MTYRIYIRHQEQRVSDKTVTDDSEIASAAFFKLVANNVGLEAAAVKSHNGRSEQYIRLDKEFHRCIRCDYYGPFVDNQECCPACRCVQ